MVSASNEGHSGDPPRAIPWTPRRNPTTATTVAAPMFLLGIDKEEHDYQCSRQPPLPEALEAAWCTPPKPSPRMSQCGKPSGHTPKRCSHDTPSQRKAVGQPLEVNPWGRAQTQLQGAIPPDWSETNLRFAWVLLLQFLRADLGSSSLYLAH